jgi:hypothetical protein
MNQLKKQQLINNPSIQDLRQRMKLREAQMHQMCVTAVFRNCCYLKYIKLHKVIAWPLLLYGYEIGYFTLRECKNYTHLEVILKENIT